MIEHIIMTPAVIITHARKSYVDFGKSNPWRRAIDFLNKRFGKKRNIRP